MNQPYAVDRSRWAQLTIFEQMGNIYSEVGRSFAARRRGDQLSCQQAMIRALDLFDATAEVQVARKSPKLKEILRAREVYLRALYFNQDPNQNPENLASLERYFFQFALAARLQR